jgi:hypothetical protein
MDTLEKPTLKKIAVLALIIAIGVASGIILASVAKNRS